MPIFQILSIIGSLLIILLLINLVRGRKLNEGYSLLWFGIAFAFLLVSLSRNLLALIASLIGADYPPAALFLIMIMGLYLIMIKFSVIISRLNENNKNLSQEIGLINSELKKIKEKNKKPFSHN